MAERTVDQIRKEIAVERVGLREDMTELQAELRSKLPFLVGGLVAATLLTIALLISIKKLRART
jgi:hypothetical protein